MAATTNFEIDLGNNKTIKELGHRLQVRQEILLNPRITIYQKSGLRDCICAPDKIRYNSSQEMTKLNQPIQARKRKLKKVNIDY